MLVCVNRWQGGAPGMVYEPARGSGFGKVGGHASFDRVTRAMSIIAAPPGTAD
jgi:acyl-CoA reductase-like NAD-dependent aldehyde dehydrogenase